MGIFLAGVEYDGIYVAGQEIGNVFAGGEEYHGGKSGVTITTPSDKWQSISGFIGFNGQTAQSGRVANISIGTTLSQNGRELFLGTLRYRQDQNSAQLRIASSATENSARSGDELSDEFETSGVITVVNSAGTSISIAMGSGDRSEPYNWRPANIDAWKAFCVATFGLTDKSTTVTFSV